MSGPTRAWVLLDESGGAKAGDGTSVTPDVLATIASALQMQINAHFVPEFGGVTVLVRAGSSPSDVQPGERVFTIRDVLPEAPGAIAYHSTDGQSVPFAVVGVTLCDSLTGAGSSLSSAMSHEVLETAGDEGCNLWADTGGGTEVAREVCDPVEVQSYVVGGVTVSNFVLPAWYVPGSPGPYSYMVAAEIAGGVDPIGPMVCAEGNGGNYLVERPTAGQGSQVNAMHRAPTLRGTPRAAKAHHWSSRVHARGVRP